MLVRRAQFVKEIEGVVDYPIRARSIAVNLVDHDNRFQAQCQRLLGHETRLRHRPLDGIDQQQHAIDHTQHPFHLAAEIGVPRGIDDVDMHTLVIDRQILGQDRDAPLLFQVVRIHDALDDVLVGREGACLLQQLIDKRGLAVVDVGDDGDVAYGTGHEG